MQLYDRTPPQSPEAERAVLGACILEQASLGVALERIQPGDFYDVNHRTIYEAMAQMYSEGRPVDLVTLSDELTKLGCFEKVGGQPFLAELLDEVPTTANTAYHADIVLDKAIRRRLIDGGNQIVSLAYSGEQETPLLVDEAERVIFDVARNKRRSDFRSIREVMHQAFLDIEERYRNRDTDILGFKSGFSDLDRLTAGFQPGSLNIVAARPSMGKTAFALNIAQFGGGKSRDSAILIFSLEMSGEQLIQRMLAAQSGVDLQSLKLGSMGKHEWDMLTEAADHLSKRPLLIDDSSSLTAMDFRARCRRAKSRYPNLELIIVDYLQLMDSGRRVDNRQQDVAETSRTLKGVAREMSCPVIALSQLSRDTEKRPDKRKIPMLSDLRDSGAIEQDADTVMFLYRDDYYEDTPQTDPEAQTTALLKLAKNRNGPTGTVQLLFQRSMTRFVSTAQGGWPGEPPPPGK